MTTFMQDHIGGTHIVGDILTQPPGPPPHHWPLQQSRLSPGLRGFHNLGAGLNLVHDVPGDGASDGVEVAITVGPPDWHQVRVGEVVQVQQKSTGRWVESHGGIVLTVQEPTGRAGLWVVDDVAGTTTVRHLETTAFLGARTNRGAHAFTRAGSKAQAPEWAFERHGARTFAIRSANAQFLDAHETGSHRVVTRPAQNNNTQLFDCIVVGAVYTLEPEFKLGHFLDAHVTGNFDVVTRTAQNNDTQEWAIVELLSEESFPQVTIQQVSTGRYLTALPHPGRKLDPKPVRTRLGSVQENQVWAMSPPHEPRPPVE